MSSYSTQNRFLELQQYNQSGQTQANMVFNGSNILDTQMFMWPYKFNLNTKNFPLYIPTIIQSFVPYNLNPSTETELVPNSEFYMMDWAITIKFDDNTSKTTPVYWMKEGYFKQPTFSKTSKYFWINNSDEICSYVTNAFDRILGVEKEVFFVKNGDRWSILVDSNSAIESIYFNDAMAKYFDFNYGYQNRIKIVKINTFIIGQEEYYNVTTSTTNNKLFPFNKLVFKSTLKVPQMNIQYNSQVQNYSDSVILSYDMIITDISQIGNSLTYTNDCSDRSLSLMGNSVLEPFTVTPYFVSNSGEVFDIILDQGDSCSISFMFF